MKQPLTNRLIVILLMLLSFVSVAAVTPEEFGYGSLQVNGTPVLGRIPLLVVTFQMTTNGSTRLELRPDANQVFNNLVFNFFSIPSVNGFFLENSRGSFSWERAGLIGPVGLDANETQTLVNQQSIDYPAEGVTRTGLDCGAGIAYLLDRISAKTGYNFAQWDNNGDKSITQEELSIVVIGNNGERSGANRLIGAAGVGQAVSGGVTLRGRVASLDHRTSFMTLTHELSHSLGTADLYSSNCFASGLTLMSCTIYPNDDDRRTFHLDPWHKMVFGWIAPRIFPLGSGGVTTLTASQINSPTGPVILYDPWKGVTEYFIIEFRNNRATPGAHHDVHLTDPGNSTPFAGATNGMVIWHVGPGNPIVYSEGAPDLTIGSSALWSGQATPPLRWRDGSPTATSLNPIAVINGGSDLVFEWMTASETWVDFQHVGPEVGTLAQPFNTLAEGVAAASHGGTVKIKAGSSAERPTITRRVALEAVGGPVTLGQ